MMKEYHKALKAFEEGLKLDPENQECKEGLYKTRQLISSSAHSKGDDEQVRHAMADPEIQMLLRDPRITQVLKDL